VPIGCEGSTPFRGTKKMTDKTKIENTEARETEKKSALRVIIHSFFVVPFLIAIFAVIVFLMVKVLTVEPNTAQDYLEHVKIGGTTKRWQGAFELSKILSNPKMVPKDERFVQEMISTFEYSTHERNPLIRSYLALAMGRTGDERFTPTLINALQDKNYSIVSSCAHALGLIRTNEGFTALKNIADHEDAQVRLQSIISLGNYLNKEAEKIFLNALTDQEVNIRWDAAVALAKIKNDRGRVILLDLLDRKYLDSFPNIDPFEQDQAMMVAIQVIPNIIDTEFKSVLKGLRDEDRSMKVREAARLALNE
jgi:hypothetical protein